jgi:hypothetical protein
MAEALTKLTKPDVSMRFLHAADIHLDSPLRGLRTRAGDRGHEIADAPRLAFVKLPTSRSTKRSICCCWLATIGMVVTAITAASYFLLIR